MSLSDIDKVQGGDGLTKMIHWASVSTNAVL